MDKGNRGLPGRERIEQARVAVDENCGDEADRLHSLLDTAEDYVHGMDPLTAADYLLTVARMEDGPAARDILRDLADALQEG